MNRAEFIRKVEKFASAIEINTAVSGKQSDEVPQILKDDVQTLIDKIKSGTGGSRSSFEMFSQSAEKRSDEGKDGFMADKFNQYSDQKSRNKDLLEQIFGSYGDPDTVVSKDINERS